MQQLILDVTMQKSKYLAEDFLPLANSFDAHRMLLSSISDNMQGALILGAIGTGKTYLLNVCKQYIANEESLLFLNDINKLEMPIESVKYLLIDNIESLNNEQQEKLFHWYNHLKDCGGKIFLVLTKPLEDLICLPDLKSRLMTLNQCVLNTPADKDIEIFLLKQAFDRQIILSDDVLKYIVLRAERSFNNIEKLLAQLDDESLRKQKKITIPLVKDFLD